MNEVQIRIVDGPRHQHNSSSWLVTFEIKLTSYGTEIRRDRFMIGVPENENSTPETMADKARQILIDTLSEYAERAKENATWI